MNSARFSFVECRLWFGLKKAVKKDYDINNASFIHCCHCCSHLEQLVRIAADDVRNHALLVILCRPFCQLRRNAVPIELATRDQMTSFREGLHPNSEVHCDTCNQMSIDNL